MPQLAKSYLKDTHPHLREQFVECIHPKTKRSIPFDELTTQAGWRCKWQCLKSICGCPHISISSVNNRAQGKGCPHCARILTYVCRCESFGTKFPELLKEYDPSNERDPFTLAPGSNIRVQWKCFKCAYVWKTKVNNRTGSNKRNCPACTHQVPTETTCLAARFPEIAKEFHPTKNAPLTTRTVMPATYKKVWWFCEKHNYDWQASVVNRTVGNSPGCVKCNESSLEYYMRLILEPLLEERAFLNIIFNTRLGNDTRLRGDFVITLLNNRKLVLEMDGQQHFMPVSYHSNDPEKANACLQITQERDQRKREWCEENKFHLLRIAYTVPQNEWKKTLLGFMAFCQECPDDEVRFAMLHTPRKNQTCDMELDG